MLVTKRVWTVVLMLFRVLPGTLVQSRMGYYAKNCVPVNLEVSKVTSILHKGSDKNNTFVCALILCKGGSPCPCIE